MKLLEIKTGIVDRLKSKIPSVNVFSGETTQGFSKPAFFVQLTLLGSERVNRFQTARSLMIMIRYHSKSEETNDILAKSDALESIFKSVLKVGDRRLTIEDIESEIIDKVLHFRFDMNYIDGEEGFVVTDIEGNERILPINEQEEELGYTEETIGLMEELEIKEGV